MELLPIDTFNNLPDLICDSNGGKILFATDDFFAVAERMILKEAPVWIESKYDEFGKWMDGWETRRKRIAGHDFSIIELGLAGTIAGFMVDTAFFTGNNAPFISIQATCMDTHSFVRKSIQGSCASVNDINTADSITKDWKTILPITKLRPGYQDTRYHVFKCMNETDRFTHVRVNIFPDGGIARLRVYGNVSLDWTKISNNDLIDLVALSNGGKAISCSNTHYGHPMQILAKGNSLGMYDGWETARNPNRPKIYITGDDGQLIIPGSEHAIIELGHDGIISKIQIDTHHYKGNFPESCLVQGKLTADSEDWNIILPRTKLGPNESKSFEISNQNVFRYIKLVMFPDGGISRLRVFGKKFIQ